MSSDDEDFFTKALDPQSSSSSLPITPSAETSSAPTGPSTRSATTFSSQNHATAEEVLRLKLELAQAQNKISRLDQELALSRLASGESGRATPAVVAEPHFVPATAPIASPTASRIPGGPTVITPGKMPFTRDLSWMAQDDTRSDTSDSLSTGGFNRARAIWNNSKPAFENALPQGQMMSGAPQSVPWTSARNINPNYEPAFGPSGMDPYRQDRMGPDQDVMRPMGRRGNRHDSRYGASNIFGPGFGGYSHMGPGPYEPAAGYASGPQGVGMGFYTPYQQQPVGTTLSPHATEFTSGGGSWKAEVRQPPFGN